MNKNRLEDIANWYMAVKRGKGARYTAEVRGFLTNINSGLLWKENTLILLKDDSNNINGCFTDGERTIPKFKRIIGRIQ